MHGRRPIREVGSLNIMQHTLAVRVTNRGKGGAANLSLSCALRAGRRHRQSRRCTTIVLGSGRAFTCRGGWSLCWALPGPAGAGCWLDPAYRLPCRLRHRASLLRCLFLSPLSQLYAGQQSWPLRVKLSHANVRGRRKPPRVAPGHRKDVWWRKRDSSNC